MRVVGVLRFSFGAQSLKWNNRHRPYNPTLACWRLAGLLAGLLAAGCLAWLWRLAACWRLALDWRANSRSRSIPLMGGQVTLFASVKPNFANLGVKAFSAQSK